MSEIDPTDSTVYLSGPVVEHLPNASEVLGSNPHSYQFFFFSSNPIMFISGSISGRDTFVCILFCNFTGTNRESPQRIEARPSEDCARATNKHSIRANDRSGTFIT